MLAARVERPPDGDLLRRELGAPVAEPATRACCGQTIPGPFIDQVAFELGNGAHHVVEEAPHSGTGVDLVLQARETDIAGFALLGKRDQVLEEATDPVEFPKDQCIPQPQIRERIIQSLPVRLGA